MNEPENSKLPLLALAGVAAIGLIYVAFSFLLSSGQAHVSGVVTLDEQVISGAQVVFAVADKEGAPPIITIADDKGRYNLVGNEGGGIAPGKYRVCVTKLALKDGTVPQGEKLVDAQNQDLLKNVLPKVYEDRSTTTLEFRISSGSQTVNLDLKKPAKGDSVKK